MQSDAEAFVAAENGKQEKRRGEDQRVAGNAPNLALPFLGNSLWGPEPWVSINSITICIFTGGSSNSLFLTIPSKNQHRVQKVQQSI